jgi:3-oxoacyl-(acyl-carrier-protein) synthase
MIAALDDAALSAADIDYVNAHATSTRRGDAAEVAAIEAALGAHAGQIPINATKSILGHAIGAAGVLAVIATVQQQQHGMLHPTINQEEADPELTLDFVPNVAREYRSTTALVNAFGIGGLNAAVVIGAL